MARWIFWGWSNVCYTPRCHRRHGASVVLGNTVYFPCTLRTRIIQYDHHEEELEVIFYFFAKQELEVIDAPQFVYRGIRSTILLTARDGVLGFAGLASSKLLLWPREVTGPGKASTWVPYKVLDPATMPRIPRLVGSIDGHIFIKTGDGVFNIKLDSGNAEKVSTSRRINKVIPYTAFCTPSAGSII